MIVWPRPTFHVWIPRLGVMRWQGLSTRIGAGRSIPILTRPKIARGFGMSLRKNWNRDWATDTPTRALILKARWMWRDRSKPWLPICQGRRVASARFCKTTLCIGPPCGGFKHCTAISIRKYAIILSDQTACRSICCAANCRFSGPQSLTRNRIAGHGSHWPKARPWQMS